MKRFLPLFLLASLPALASGPYTIRGLHNREFDGLDLTNDSGPCLVIENSTNITIRNAHIAHCHGVAVAIYKTDSITVQNSRIEDANGGVYAAYSSGVRVVDNRFKNFDSRRDDSARGQFVQFNHITGSHNVISGNVGVDEPGKSYSNDLINVYQSSGTSASPIVIADNCLQGGGPINSGCGILVGDYGGANISVLHNTLVNPGACGIGVAGGRDIGVHGNRIFGARQNFTNVGLYVWAQANTPCSDITVSNNYSDFTNATGQRNPAWDSGNCGVVDGWRTNDWQSSGVGLACSGL
jgi:hypothetical protein